MLTWETEIAKLFTLPRKAAKPSVQNWRIALPKQQVAERWGRNNNRPKIGH